MLEFQLEQSLGLVYVVDDDPNIRRLASLALKDCGFETQEFSGGDELLKALQRRVPDLVLLDWVMPVSPDGLNVCLRIKKSDNPTIRAIPVTMLSAKSDEVDCVLALEMGADDYITKPFRVKELCAKVKAGIRRSKYFGSMSKSDDIITCGEITLNQAFRTVSKNGKLLSLTMKEFDLLKHLMLGKGRVLNRDQLMEKVWDVAYSGDARTVDVHIRYLRQKIEDDSGKPRYVLTVRGVGYRFTSEDEIK